MELKVRKIGNGYGVLLPKELLDEMDPRDESRGEHRFSRFLLNGKADL